MDSSSNVVEGSVVVGRCDSAEAEFCRHLTPHRHAAISPSCAVSAVSREQCGLALRSWAVRLCRQAWDRQAMPGVECEPRWQVFAMGVAQLGKRPLLHLRVRDLQADQLWQVHIFWQGPAAHITRSAAARCCQIAVAAPRLHLRVVLDSRKDVAKASMRLGMVPSTGHPLHRQLQLSSSAPVPGCSHRAEAGAQRSKACLTSKISVFTAMTSCPGGRKFPEKSWNAQTQSVPAAGQRHTAWMCKLHAHIIGDVDLASCGATPACQCPAA